MDTQAYIRQMAARQNAMREQIKMLISGAAAPQTPQEELDALPGRRIFYTLSGRQSFTAAQLGLRADPVSFTVSQDGPFVMTAYPLISWRPNLPATATNLGRWSPVASWPLALQHSTDTDIIDISYEFFDGGSQRAFNNEPVAPILSRPDNIIKVDQPTLFAPNSNIQVFVTYEAINFDGTAGVPATGGELVVSIPGYRILNS
jgi:hypothetical protein